MKFGLLLCLLPSVIASFPCGIHLPEQGVESSSRRTRAIIGGNNVNAGKWPWQMFLKSTHSWDNGISMTCGGTILSERWILTAAHCLPVNYTIVQVVGGVSNKKEIESNVTKSYSVAVQILKHQNYVNNTAYGYDIALLKLKSPIVFNEFVSPICLPNIAQSIPDDGQAVATGFGMHNNRVTNEISNEADYQLRETAIPIIKSEVCAKRWAEFFPNSQYSAWDKLVCAGSMGHGTYTGDSGGPLMMKASDGRWFQVGITSFSNHDLGTIQQDILPGAYTDVRPYCDWIKETTGGEVNCQEEVQLQDMDIPV